MARSSTTRVAGMPALPGAGRKKVAPELQVKLKTLAPQAIDNLGEMLDSEDKQERMFATKEVLDRVMGKAKQHITKRILGKKSPRDYALEELERMRAATEEPGDAKPH